MCSFRVLNIYEKYYNKWFISKNAFKMWKKEAKPYKLKVRMLKKNVLNEYSDVELCGTIDYRKDDICKFIDDTMNIDVVSNMEHLVV